MTISPDTITRTLRASHAATRDPYVREALTRIGNGEDAATVLLEALTHAAHDRVNGGPRVPDADRLTAAASTLHDRLAGMTGYVSCGIGEGELVVYARKPATRRLAPSTHDGFRVRVEVLGKVVTYATAPVACDAFSAPAHNPGARVVATGGGR